MIVFAGPIALETEKQLCCPTNWAPRQGIGSFNAPSRRFSLPPMLIQDDEVVETRQSHSFALSTKGLVTYYKSLALLWRALRANGRYFIPKVRARYQ